MDALFDALPLLTSQSLGEGTFDFIFIDGDHSRKGVLTNFTEALLLSNPGGCIGFHGTLTLPKVGEALSEIAERYAGVRGCRGNRRGRARRRVRRRRRLPPARNASGVIGTGVA